VRRPEDHDRIAARFATNLRRLRRESELSQESLAIRTDLHRSEVSLLERGLRMPRLDTIVRLVATLGVSADRLMEGIEWVEGDTDPSESSYEVTL
jgi:transcriptional regulator with XRE-family HTH domain